jgi:remodeling and spacing factor 1
MNWDTNDLASNNASTEDELGLPSEDSGDGDFDPAGPDSSEDQKDGLNSEESDFTSDSDDFCAEIAKSCGQDEVSASPLSNVKLRAADNRSDEENHNNAFMDMELEQDMVLPVSSRRQVERLDYKKLYDVCMPSLSYLTHTMNTCFLCLVFVPHVMP